MLIVGGVWHPVPVLVQHVVHDGFQRLPVQRSLGSRCSGCVLVVPSLSPPRSVFSVQALRRVCPVSPSVSPCNDRSQRTSDRYSLLTAPVCAARKSVHTAGDDFAELGFRKRSPLCDCRLIEQ
jgi:hypothetical protein